MKTKNIKKLLVKGWNFVWHDDSLLAQLISLVIFFLLLKYLVFPGIGFLLNTKYPIVAVVSGSMEHKVVGNEICGRLVGGEDGAINVDDYWDICGDFYEGIGITKEDFIRFKYSNGINIGDVIIVYGKDPSAVKVGDVIIFKPLNDLFFKEKGPVIHRVVKKWDEHGALYFTTKGDHNGGIGKNFEDRIPAENVFGVAVLRIPYLGLPKYWLMKLLTIVFG